MSCISSTNRDKYLKKKKKKKKKNQKLIIIPLIPKKAFITQMFVTVRFQ